MHGSFEVSIAAPGASRTSAANSVYHCAQQQPTAAALSTSTCSIQLATMTGKMVEALDTLMNKMEVGHEGARAEGE
jgi:hypothetical protein